MLRALSIEEAYQEANLAGRRVRPAAYSSWPFASMLRTTRDALREGRVAHREYERLRSRGISHDTAIRQALASSHRRK
jgi:hypothetical protein